MGIYYVGTLTYNSDYLMHHGILGQKWGVRRFQNPDGTLTEAGKKRYGTPSAQEVASWIHESSAAFYVNDNSKRNLAKNTIASFDDAKRELAGKVNDVKEAENRVSSVFSKTIRAKRNNKDASIYDKQLDEALDDYDKKRGALNSACKEYSSKFLGVYGDDSAASHRYQDEGLKIITIKEEYSDMLYDELVDGLYSRILFR